MSAQAPLRILIVDDEPLARVRLRHLLQQMVDPVCDVVGEAGHAQQTKQLMQHQICDAVLLDIQMPGLDGLRLAQQLPLAPGALKPPAVIFVTAHAEHALRAFELQALDYLTKPVQAARLQQALRRVAQALVDRAPSQALAHQPQPDVAQAGMLVIRDRQRLLRIPLAEIVMARAGHKLVTLATLTREHVIDESLADLELRLGDGFVRVHRNALVARSAARELVRCSGEGLEEGWVLRVMPGDVWVPVSRRLVAAVREALGVR